MTDIPTGTEAGTYTVWYRVVGDENYSDIAPQSEPVTIAKADQDDPNDPSDPSGTQTPEGTATPQPTAPNTGNPSDPSGTQTPGGMATAQPALPKTGDENILWLWMLLMVVSLAGIGVVTVFMRKGRKEK